MIRITRQDEEHQYDSSGNIITTWSDKKCAWIVEPEFSRERIDWWGKNDDFPRGYSEEEFSRMFPGENPTIRLKLVWNTKEDLRKLGATEEQLSEVTYPYVSEETWTDLNVTPQEALDKIIKEYVLRKALGVNEVILWYNPTIIFKGGTK